MEILPSKTYRLLKSLKHKSLLETTIQRKYGKTANSRLRVLSNKLYIEAVSKFDKWGSPTEPVKYSISEKGLAYLEDHKSYIVEQKFQVIKNSVIIPIIVSVISSLLINGISLWLQWKQ